MIVGVLFCLVSASVAAEEYQREAIGDWGVQCEKPADEGKHETCYLFQNVTNKENNQGLLRVRIGFKPDDSKQPMIVVTVPLGTLLPAGAALMAEGAEPVKMVFFTCAAEGCVTLATPMPADMVGAMKKGEQASVRVATVGRQVVGLPVSLKGFTKGLDALAK